MSAGGAAKLLICALLLGTAACRAPTVNAADSPELQPVVVEGQPLAAAIRRVLDSLEYLGAPLPVDVARDIREAARRQDAAQLQRLLDAHVPLVVEVSPQAVKATRGSADIILQQAGFVPVLVKVINPISVTDRLQIASSQAGAVYAGVSELSMKRQRQEFLRDNENKAGATDRYLQLEMFQSPPMNSGLSGLGVEYVIALVYSSEAGRHAARVAFELEKDDNTRVSGGEVFVPLTVRPAMPVRLAIKDSDGQPTIARLLFRDKVGHVYPPQAKRLAPDLFFQPHVYRGDGESILLAPGEYAVQSSRGPEYLVQRRTIVVTADEDQVIDIALQRWIDPQEFGLYSGDHHIHAAGCAHYTSPTEGVTPRDMFRQVKGEGLNVGCVLTWGPCFDFQRQFFAPTVDELSEPRTLLKYDLEISGFGSQALGHVCLLGLNDQVYPGSTSTKGWPTWTTPVMRWAKTQGAVTGYAHSASGLAINPAGAAKRLLAKADTDESGRLEQAEAAATLLPETFVATDTNGDRALSEQELAASHDRVAEQLPNIAVPEMNGVGAMEICVSTAEGVCDFISAMDTPRIQEWNCWYHILNCGFPLKVSGETDFPCMSSRAVGQGRVYVQLGKVEQLDFAAWCKGLAAGRSYVSDGYAHAVQFSVSGSLPGSSDVVLVEPGTVMVRAQVAFAPETPLAVAHGNIVPPGRRRLVGDTVELHGERSEEMVAGGLRLVEVVVNGVVVVSQEVAADGMLHDLEFAVPISRSSWVALRQFPQLHTNSVNVIVAGQPIRASRRSALWCAATIERLWETRGAAISANERDEAKRTFDRAIERYREIANEAPEGS